MLSEYLLTEMARLGGKENQRGAELPLHRQLYEALRRGLLDGKLAAGDRLPSSRDLAKDLNLSRNTVVAAIGQLTVEGYLVSQVGSGTYVHDTLPSVQSVRGMGGAGTGGAGRMGTSTDAAAWAGLGPPVRRLSRRGDALSQTFCARDLEVQPFTPGAADFSAFPVALWQRLQNKHWRAAYPDMLDYNDSGGYGPLRRAVADYLRVFRSVQLDAFQVIITSGTQQSLELCAQLLADHGDTVWIEDPAYWGAIKAFMATGLALHPVAVDEQGMAPSQADEQRPPKLIYLTPSHQYPTGAVTSLARRQQLLATAARCGAWVLEDDYDSEFRFSGPPISSLEGLDPDGRVLYMGTFSKVLYPGIKLGYLVVPNALVPAFKQAHYDLNRPGQMPLQAALAEFIEMGHFTSALRRARQTYAERRKALVKALAPALATGHARLLGAEQGLHLCLRLPLAVDDRALATRLSAHGLTARPLSAYCLQRKDLRGLLLGYGYASPASIARHGPLVAAAVVEAVESMGAMEKP
jgi:GntR family transcriptional regulator / MocR family aminotransferase